MDSFYFDDVVFTQPYDSEDLPEYNFSPMQDVEGEVTMNEEEARREEIIKRAMQMRVKADVNVRRTIQRSSPIPILKEGPQIDLGREQGNRLAPSIVIEK